MTQILITKLNDSGNAYISLIKNNNEVFRTFLLRINIFFTKFFSFSWRSQRYVLSRYYLMKSTKKFGLLEIKAVKCGKSESINELGEAAYIQVKDISDNTNEKIFVFNGWTFSSSPSLKPIDHPVYDLWLVGCNNV